MSAKIKLCGIIGDPIEHTLSPIMHNAAFRELMIDYVYVPFRVKREDLGKAIEGMKALNIRGVNVTIPHKVAVIPFLDELDPVAGKIGAVNTIVNEEGVLRGYNTDASGFLKILSERKIEVKGRNVVILGAGGASRAISFVLAEENANLTILNRTLSKAKECADGILKFSQGKIKVAQLNDKNIAETLQEADILVNTTSVGMDPDIDKTLITFEFIKPSLIVIDIVYNPIKTRLLKEAEKAGAQTVSGLDMLVWQGALAFEKWTGYKAPIEIMREKVAGALKSYEG